MFGQAEYQAKLKAKTEAYMAVTFKVNAHKHLLSKLPHKSVRW